MLSRCSRREAQAQWQKALADISNLYSTYLNVWQYQM